MKKSNGFTFIELLAVIAVLISIGAVIGTILIISLRGTNKTNTITNVRQNGNYALSIMAKMIREAKHFDGVSLDDNSYTINCIQPTPSPGAPTPTPIPYKYLRITSFDNKQTTFACCLAVGPTPPLIASGSAYSSPSTACDYSSSIPSLIDTKSVSLDVSTCSFTCSQISAVNVPTIQIHFELNAYNVNPTVLPEKTAGASAIPFDTSITFRNLIR